MVCAIPRTYVPGASLGLDPGADSLPTVPVTNSPIAVRNFLQDIVNLIESPGNQIPIPGIIQNFTGTLFTGGINLKWDPEPNSFGYIIYRGSTAVLGDARAITTIYDGMFHRQEWFDKYGQGSVGLLSRYYWINGFNKEHKMGAVAGPLVKVDTG